MEYKEQQMHSLYIYISIGLIFGTVFEILRTLSEISNSCETNETVKTVMEIFVTYLFINLLFERGLLEEVIKFF